MLTLLDAISNSGWATWVRDSETVFGYATVLAFHTLGMIFVVGISSAIALRTLGVARDLPIAPLLAYAPLMFAGFFVNLATGVVLFLLDGSTFATNVDYWIKMAAVAGAIVTARSLLASLRDPAVAAGAAVPPRGRALALRLLVFWLIAVTAGRLTAYDALVERQSAVAVLIAFVALVVIVRYVAPRLFGWESEAGAATASMRDLPSRRAAR